MKILHVLSSDKFSGAENVVCQIIGLFKGDDGIEMFYVSPDGEIKDSLKEMDVPYIPLKKLSVSSVRKVIKEQKPDLIYSHDMRASFVCALACGKIPLVSHIHNNAFDSRKLSLKSLLYVFAGLKAKHIFWVSQSAFDGYAFHKLFRKKSSVLYNVIDIDALYKKMSCDDKTYDFDVIYVGRLTSPKNPQRLMHVFKLLCEKNPNVKIAVVGAGELEEETKALCKEYDLQNNVSFLGFQPNPSKMLHDSKVMVITSRWEGLPMCALEAMALGVPIVGTPVDGLKYLVEQNVDGYLSDKDDELASDIAFLVDDKNLHDRMSANSIKKAYVVNDKTAYKTEINRIINEIAQNNRKRGAKWART